MTQKTPEDLTVSLYMNEKTPDGYFVDENGVWKEN